ncbi:MAG: signal peptidase I [Oscillospiraceae bacterium]|nr:signal peptidase I [Oscillospiraceae bacterium]
MAKKGYKKPKSPLARAVNIAVSVFLAVAVIILAYSVCAAVIHKNDPENATVFGIKPIVILSGSMENPVTPNQGIKTDAIIIVKRAEFQNVKVGEVITYKNGQSLITHRVYEFVTDELTGEPAIRTKGDNMEKPDDWLVHRDELQFRLLFTMNWVADFKHEVFPNEEGLRFAGLFKWILFPALVIVLPVCGLWVLHRLVKRLREENEQNRFDSPEFAARLAQPPDVFEDADFIPASDAPRPFTETLSKAMEGFDLDFADLDGMDFSDLDLDGLDLDDIDFSNIDWSDLDFEGLTV